MDCCTIDHLSFTYPGASSPALRDVTIRVPQGSITVLTGVSGSGKSTLLRQLFPVLTPHGDRYYATLQLNGADLPTMSAGEQAERIGYVAQDPATQLVTERVSSELAFGLENLGTDPGVMRRRVAESAARFGLEHLFARRVDDLSGGEQQRLALAAALITDPELLLLDEPTARLDPQAAEQFLDTLCRLNRELGITILLSSHHLEALALADQVIVLDQGEVIRASAPDDISRWLMQQGHPLVSALPAATRLSGQLRGSRPDYDWPDETPLDVRQGKAWLSALGAIDDSGLNARSPGGQASAAAADQEKQYPVLLSGRGLSFRYDRGSPDILDRAGLDIRGGEILGLVGANGSGKTTLVNVLSGQLKPWRGQIRQPAGPVRIAALPQDPQLLFIHDTVREDLAAVLEGPAGGQPAEAQLARIRKAAAETGLAGELLERHPYDLSGGEQQLAALTRILLTDPDVLLLDEPTRGIDTVSARRLGGLLGRLADQGKGILLVSHDLDFIASTCGRAAFFFNGEVIDASDTGAFFGGNQYYTTAACRLARPDWPGITVEETAAAVLEAIGRHTEDEGQESSIE